MTFAVDTTSHATAQDAGGTTLTWAHTCGTGTTKLVALIMGAGDASQRNVTGVTYNGSAMTKIVDKDDTAFENVEIWRLNSPTTGSAQNIVVTYGASGGQQAAGAISFIDADAAEGTPVSATASTANPSMSVTTVSGDIAVGMYASDLGVDGDTVADQTQIFQDEDIGSGDSDASAEYTTATTTSTTLSWTAPAPGGGAWAIAGVAIKPAAAAQNIPIGQPSETDTAQSMTVGKLKAIGQPSETDSSQPMTGNGSSVFLDVAHSRELRNHANVVWASVSGWTWAWYDDPNAFMSGGPGAPKATGTFNTNGNGEARLEVPATTLTAGQSGALVVRHPSYPGTPIMELRVIPIGP